MASRTTRPRKPQPSQQTENQSRAKWTSELTRTLVDLMVEQVEKGNTSNKSFSKKGWKFICDDFRIQTGYWWDSEQLKSRYVALRKQYINVALLLDHPDFNWDEASCTVTAPDEAWDGYIKEHPDVETVRSMGCPIYNQLRTIFAEPKTPENQNEGVSFSPPSPAGQSSTVKLEEISPSESEKYTDLASRKRGRKGTEDAIARGILEMAAATKLRAEAIAKFNARFSITDCVRALDELQGVHQQLYFAALDLFINRNARETFLTLKVDKRLIWLQRKCLLYFCMDSFEDIFESSLTLEETHVKQGYDEGYADGLISGKEEGQQVGLKTGFEVGEELGFYRGCVDVWNCAIQVDDSNYFSARIQRTIKQMDELLQTYPVSEPENESVTDMMDSLRLKFRAVCASLNVKLEYNGYPKSSDAGNIEF